MAPNTLGTERTEHVIPIDVAKIMTQSRCFAVEKITSARRLLRKLDKNFPIDDSTFYVLNKKTNAFELSKMIQALVSGNDLIVISEAGCPGIADPGAKLVALAHENEIRVEPLVGPSSILLALIGSGMNGQQFTFHGYLPKEKNERVTKLKELEKIVVATGATQIFMDTPFRNNHVIEDIAHALRPETKVCIACDLTMSSQYLKTFQVKKTKNLNLNLNKRPAIFLIGV